VTRGGSVLTEVGPGDVPVALVKMGVRAADRRNLRRQARIVRLIHSRTGLASLSGLVAKPLLAGEESGWTFVIESRLPGRPSTADQGSGTTRLAALSAIALLHRGTVCQTTVREDLLHRWVTTRVGTVSALIDARSDAADAAALTRLESELRSRLDGCSVRVGWIHGDYWPGNILVSEAGSIVGIVDWDSLQSRELPLHDSLHYVVTARRLAEKQPWGGTVRRLLSAASSDAEESAFAELHATPPSIDRRTALLLYWLRGVEANGRRHPATTGQATWVRANVRPVLETLI